MKKIMSLAVITALSLGFSGCVNNDNVVKPQCKVYTLQGYDKAYFDAQDFCKNKNLQVNPRPKYSSEVNNVLAFECLTKKEVQDIVDKVGK
jgi:PBP1b-binding outer membrane lipoprotein LpoB